MNWYNYSICFFAGMFLANVVPHFVMAFLVTVFRHRSLILPEKDCHPQP